MTTLTLAHETLTIPPARAMYNSIRNKYQTIALQAASQFSASYVHNFKNIDDVHTKATGIAMDLLNPSIEAALADLVSHAVYDIDLTGFSDYYDAGAAWESDFAEVDDRYMAITLKAEELNDYRTQRRESRGRWVGGGFGIGGAVKGAMQAGAMNIATGAVHGTFNLIGKGLTAAGNAIEKNKLFADPSTKAALVNSIYRLVFNVHYGLVNALNDRKPELAIGYVSTEDSAKATRLLDNIAAGRIPEAAIREQLTEAISLNPYDDAFYHCWLRQYGDDDGQLETVERYFGMQVAGSAKNEMMRAQFSTLDFSTLAACDASQAKLESYATSIGYRDFAGYLAEIAAIKAQLERSRLTVAGVAYPNDEAAETARDDLVRTVNGKVYPTHEKADEIRAQKTVGILLLIAIAFVPFIAAFFTLRKGYSLRARLLSFAWLAAAIYMGFKPQLG